VFENVSNNCLINRKRIKDYLFFQLKPTDPFLLVFE
jgi:hypothetical protein